MGFLVRLEDRVGKGEAKERLGPLLHQKASDPLKAPAALGALKPTPPFVTLMAGRCGPHVTRHDLQIAVRHRRCWVWRRAAV